MSKSAVADLEYPPNLAANIPDHDSPAYQYAPKPICAICLDDGLVTLLGTERTGNGPTYERGCAPCQWCQLGYRLLHVLRSRGEHPLAEYRLDDIDPPVQQVNWKDSRERLRQRTATTEGLAAMRKALASFAVRGRELDQGTPAPPKPGPFG